MTNLADPNKVSLTPEGRRADIDGDVLKRLRWRERGGGSAGGGGTGTVTDATTVVKGKLQLAGDFDAAGTAAAPRIKSVTPSAGVSLVVNDLNGDLLNYNGGPDTVRNERYLMFQGTTAAPMTTLGSQMRMSRVQAIPAMGQLAGTISSSGVNVTGVGTAFTTDLAVNDLINSRSGKARVATITDDTHMTTVAAFSPAIPSGSAYGLGNPVDSQYFSGVHATVYATNADFTMPVGVWGAVFTKGNHDAVGVVGSGRVDGEHIDGVGARTGIGTGAYFEGFRNHASAAALGAEVRAINALADGSNTTYAPVGFPKVTGLWITSTGSFNGDPTKNRATVGVAIGGGVNLWDVGFAAQTGTIYDTAFRDDNVCVRGMYLAGTYSGGAIHIPSDTGGRATGLRFGATTYLHKSATTQLMLNGTASATNTVFRINATSGNKAALMLDSANNEKWRLSKEADESVVLYDSAGAQNTFQVATGDGLKLGGTYSVAALQLPSTAGSAASGIKYGTDTFLHRSATTNLMLNGTSSAATNTVFHVNSATSRQALVSFDQANVAKWTLGNNTDNSLLLTDSVGGQNTLQVISGDGLKLLGTYSTAALNITSTARTEVSGIILADANLYCSAANRIKIKHSLDCNNGSGTATSNAGAAVGVFLNGTTGVADINRNSVTNACLRIYGATGESSARFSINGSGQLQWKNASSGTVITEIAPDATDGTSLTGIKIGTATSQLIGFFNKAPVNQRGAIASPTSDIVGTKAAIDAIRQALIDLGLTA